MAKRVLVIDDSPMTVDLIKGALVAAGFEVEAAADLAQLDERLGGAAFDLVLVDVNMPEMYGDDVVEFLRVQRRLSAQLFLYSDVPEAELAKKTQASGADGYITKGSGLDAAVDAIRAALEPTEPEAPATPPPERRVLVIEPTPSLAPALEKALKAAGGLIAGAASSGDATRALLNRKTRPDVVVVDVRTTGVDVAELNRTLKSNAIFAGIKVLLVGPAGATLDALKASSGADAAVAVGADVAHAVSTLWGNAR